MTPQPPQPPQPQQPKLAAIDDAPADESNAAESTADPAAAQQPRDRKHKSRRRYQVWFICLHREVRAKTKPMTLKEAAALVELFEFSEPGAIAIVPMGLQKGMTAK